ncbi:TFIIH subunit Tfb4/p34 [Peziza echinospora]|nr:TFIIH subunit Tfb4/p34 [Peziza echinospora]
MNAVDASAHYVPRTEVDILPSLLVVILDTNPFAWDALSTSPTSPLTISQALANILLFINAHIAFSQANKVAVIASHTKTAKMLYPPPPPTSQAPPPPPHLTHPNIPQHLRGGGGGGGGAMDSAASTPGPAHNNNSNNPGTTTTSITTTTTTQTTTSTTALPPPDPERDANKYRQFRIIEDHVTSAVRALITSTTESSLSGTNMTMMAGALTLALSYIHKLCMPMEDNTIGGHTQASGGAGGGGGNGGADKKDESDMTMNARILVVSVSGDLAVQYIPIMNCIFAAQRKKIPIDICKIAGDSVFLQQASDATDGVYMQLQDPSGLLQYLMMAFLPDQTSRKHLVLPTQVNVDFRAACFCHKRVVDIGFVCSICLSIFCSPPAGALCTTCGTKLDISSFGHGGKPAVLVTRKKKKKRKADAVTGNGEA